jgi:hypothetical protein
MRSCEPTARRNCLSTRKVRLREGKSPWTGEPWMWLRDEISPKSCGAEKTAERLRKPVGGT